MKTSILDTVAQEAPPLVFEEDEPKIKTVSEEVFWGEYDPRWQGDELITIGHGKKRGNTINMDRDSYIWAFTGSRGAGKTEYMSYIAEKVAYLYDKRIVSNYPIKLRVLYRAGGSKVIESEPLELGKLLMFDEDYKGVIICLDEAPQIINRLATMTWKNRLLDLWIQQIRKSRNSLLYASQNENWVDNELRFQTDILVKCKDFSRRYPGAGYEPGEMVLAEMYDKSGQWTGYSFEEWPRMVKKKRVLLRPIWDTYDTFHQLDVFESLAKAKLDVREITVGNKEDGEENPDKVSYEELVMPCLEQVLASPKKRVVASEFYRLCGLDTQGKVNVGKMFGDAGVYRGSHERDLVFDKFSMSRFKAELAKYERKH